MNNRIIFCDIAKCWAIFSVIIYHVARVMHLELVEVFANTYFLSLFFFISGLWLSRSLESKFVPLLRKNLLHLLLPFFICMTLYSAFQIILKGGDIRELFAYFWSDSKGGGWFLLVLFIFILVAKCCDSIVKVLKIKSWIVKILLFVLPLMIVLLLISILPEKIYSLLSLPSFRRYWLLFVAGYFVAGLWGVNIFQRKIILFLSTLGYGVCAFYYTLYVRELHSNVDFVVWLITNVLGCFFYLSFFDYLSRKLGDTRKLVEIGKNTLGIYLLHYFFFSVYSILIYPLIQEYLFSYYSYISMLIISLVIIFLSFWLVKMIRKNSVLSLFLLGINTKK
ncbi:acyltransferase family protein [Odoribacter sp. OttesenSCG-928-A06]|nr:acyltransferase family protein [Odoribacter sp. OttesenSCG-928-A06]